MKQKTIVKKLSLNKKTVDNLDDRELTKIKGGAYTVHCIDCSEGPRCEGTILPITVCAC